ncbi:Ribosomal RNA processing protein [Rasamsonia emersonii CBS 393.64]|uniref:Ribosomal RNA processing protein n=1 Tax=Rasamsonia emersonii (strain ATCC 16479 / CBS 393.64 / IMI 116815) TaxID=1408163 RepID=A0A0F4YW19_RASE3|nr:Ribosomal RNA processing protein [Rasamsonia emersonii CBS 393.64]KKA22424.1 Ribosomal RNA processing protein [Rasamsonia emersonii CBS 393.64]
MATADESSQIQKTPFVKELASSGFYHSDRPLTQQALARALSYSLVPSLPEETRLRFLRAFWITIGREFHAIDRLRLDKYLFLIRCYVGVAFEIFLKNKIKNKKVTFAAAGEREGEEGTKKRKRGGAEERSPDSTKKRRKDKEGQHADTNDHTQEQEESETQEWPELEAYISLLEEGPLCPINFDPTDNKTKPKKNTTSPDDEIEMPHGPDGLRYHLIDIWIDELAKVIDTDDDKEEKNDQETGDEETNNGPSKPLLKDRCNVPIDLLLRPFEKLKAESPTKTVRRRACEVLDDERLVEWGFRTKPADEEDEDDDEEEEEWGGFGD